MRDVIDKYLSCAERYSDAADKVLETQFAKAEVRRQAFIDAIETLGPPEHLARVFHYTYEKKAEELGYETRKDTREFNPKSLNGILMITVCKTILDSFDNALRQWAGEV